MTDTTSDDVRDDFILQERLSGKSARAISKQLRCTVGEVDAALDRTLPKIDNDARRRYVALDLSRLDELLKVFFARAIENADAQAGLLVVKILERRALLLGLRQPAEARHRSGAGRETAHAARTHSRGDHEFAHRPERRLQWR